MRELKVNGKSIENKEFQPLIEDGKHLAKILNINYKEEQLTRFGYQDIVEVELEVSVSVVKISLKYKIYPSLNENSKCYGILMDFYNGTLPQEIDFQEMLGATCKVEIKNNKSEKSNRWYSNVVDIKFIHMEDRLICGETAEPDFE